MDNEKYGGWLVWEMGKNKKEKWKRGDGEMGDCCELGEREKKISRMGKKKKTKREKKSIGEIGLWSWDEEYERREREWVG